MSQENYNVTSLEEIALSNIENYKECLLMLACSNTVSTNKYKLLVIGKSAKSRILKHVQILSEIHRSNRLAKITQKLFREFLDLWSYNLWKRVKIGFKERIVSVNKIQEMLLLEKQNN